MKADTAPVTHPDIIVRLTWEEAQQIVHTGEARPDSEANRELKRALYVILHG